MALAECLFNLQTVPGFDGRLESIKDNSSVLESALGELECARYVSRPEFELRFIKPPGVRKCKDFEITSPSKRTLHCEVKTKLSDTAATKGTVLDAFGKARKQVPKGQPGIMFLRIPESWTQNSKESAEACIAAMAKTARNRDYPSKFVLFVFVAENFEMEGLRCRCAYHYFVIRNVYSHLYGDDITAVFETLRNPRPPEWFGFSEFVRQRHPTWVKIGIRMVRPQ
jgi:hypothetical protein